jgi:hypothetical protein
VNVTTRVDRSAIAAVRSMPDHAGDGSAIASVWEDSAYKASEAA